MVVDDGIMISTGSVAMECNRMLIVGGVDGKIRLLDGQLRSTTIERTFDAYTVSQMKC